VLSAIATNVSGAVDLLPRGEQAEALTEGFRSAFLAGAGFAALGAVLAFTLVSSRDSRAHVEAVQSGDADAVPVAA
jgi:hypothetical protein